MQLNINMKIKNSVKRNYIINASKQISSLKVLILKRMILWLTSSKK